MIIGRPHILLKRDVVTITTFPPPGITEILNDCTVEGLMKVSKGHWTGLGVPVSKGIYSFIIKYYFDDHFR